MAENIAPLLPNNKPPALFSPAQERAGALAGILGGKNVGTPNYGNDDALAQGFSLAIHPGLNQTNLIAAVVHGTIIELYVNHRRVAVVGSSTYTHGRIGVVVSGSASNQTEVIFQNAKVWKL